MNDWGEGTQIEPSREFGYRDLELIQKTRREFPGTTFSATATDLQLPAQLLEARRLHPDQGTFCDAAVTAIGENRLEDGRRLVQQLFGR